MEPCCATKASPRHTRRVASVLSAASSRMSNGTLISSPRWRCGQWTARSASEAWNPFPRWLSPRRWKASRRRRPRLAVDASRPQYRLCVGESRVKKVPLSEVKDDLSRYLREAEDREVVITRHGKPAGVLIGFASEDDWFDYRLENDARFLARIEKARESLRAGQGVRLEDVD